jgi:hypothetical protein
MSVNLADPLAEPSDSELNEIAAEFGACVSEHIRRVDEVFLERMVEAINEVAKEIPFSHKTPCARF